MTLEHSDTNSRTSLSRSVLVTNNRVTRESDRIHKCTSIPWRSSYSRGQITYISQWISLVRHHLFGLR